MGKIDQYQSLAPNLVVLFVLTALNIEYPFLSDASPMWITITTTICYTFVSLLCITLGYLLRAGFVGADAILVSFSLKPQAVSKLTDGVLRQDC